MIARVLSVSWDSSCEGSIVASSSRMSTKRGVTPHCTMASTVAAKVAETVITSSPGPTPQARSASQSASVPLPMPTQCAAPQ